MNNNQVKNMADIFAILTKIAEDNNINTFAPIQRVTVYPMREITLLYKSQISNLKNYKVELSNLFDTLDDATIGDSLNMEQKGIFNIEYTKKKRELNEEK